MNVDAIRDFIRTEIVNDGDVEIAADDDLLLSGLLDSLGVARLIQHLESECGAIIPPEDVTLENFQSLNSISAYLSQSDPSSRPP